MTTELNKEEPGHDCAGIDNCVDFTDAQWRERLSPEQYQILRKEGTEPPNSHPYVHEKRMGRYHCAGCGVSLFEATAKFESGTGWPSFFDVLPGRVATRIDRKMFVARTEYHCANCGGHMGHVFNDGPEPSGLRYCNNGLALTFCATADAETAQSKE